MLTRVALVGLSTLMFAACGSAERGLAGYRMEPAPQLSSIVLPDASDRDSPFRLTAEADGLLILFLGFTNCPDACPATMTSISRAIDRTETDAPVNVAMVTVDPERDTAITLTKYVRAFVDDGHALRPTSTSDLEQLAGAIGAQYTVDDHGNHESTEAEVAHTSFAYVVDESGTVVLVWTADINADEMADDLEILADRLYG